MRDVSVTIAQIVPFAEDATAGRRTTASSSPPSQSRGAAADALRHPRYLGRREARSNDLVDLQREFSAEPRVHSQLRYRECRDRHGFNPPLSWHLTDGQSEEIRLTWGDEDIARRRRSCAEALSPDTTLLPLRSCSLPAPQRNAGRYRRPLRRYNVPPRSVTNR